MHFTHVRLSTFSTIRESRSVVDHVIELRRTPGPGPGARSRKSRHPELTPHAPNMWSITRSGWLGTLS